MDMLLDNLYIKTKDFSVSGEYFSLFYNEKLDCLQTFPQPENLEKYYESNDYISHTDGNKGFFEKTYQLVKRYMLGRKVRLLEKYIKNKGSLLDIGAGTGDFLRIAQEKGWQVVGVEPNQKAIDNARKKNISLYKNLEEVQGTFDCITLWHVLEHIPDLQTQIDFINQHLQPNGVLIVAVPNYKSKDASIYQEFWAGYDVPRHLWHFSKTCVSRLFAENNFQIISTKPMFFDAFYVSLLSEKYKTGKMNFVKGFVNGLRSNLSAIRTGEYSSLIYFLKRIE